MANKEHRALIVSVISVLISIMSASYAIRSFYVTQRGYVGIVQQGCSLAGTPPDSLLCNFTVKNVGSLPASISVKPLELQLLKGSDLYTVTMGPQTEKSLLMPSQQTVLSLRFQRGNESQLPGISFADILEGRAVAKPKVRIDYSSAGVVFENVYWYEAEFQFTTTRSQPEFLTLYARGN